MFRICVNYSEKRSTIDQFQNATIGATVEAANLELSTPEAIAGKTRELFAIARSCVQQQLLDVVPQRAAADANGQIAHSENGHGGNGHGNGNGNGRRSFGRPQPEPSPKQRVLLQKLAKERGLSAGQVGEFARREFGKDVPQLDRHEMSRLLETLMDQGMRP